MFMLMQAIRRSVTKQGIGTRNLPGEKYTTYIFGGEKYKNALRKLRFLIFKVEFF